MADDSAETDFSLAARGLRSFFSLCWHQSPDHAPVIAWFGLFVLGLSMNVRKQIYQNINVAAINAGLRGGRFTLDIQPGEYSGRGEIEDWTLNEAGYEGHVMAHHIGFGEINIRVNLTKPCKLESSAWLERKDGKWLQIPDRIDRWSMSRVPRPMVGPLLQHRVHPNGYKDSGPVKY